MPKLPFLPKNHFYGWNIVGAGMAMQFLQTLLLNQAFGAYIALLVEERGWSKTSLSGAAAMQSVEAAFLGPLLGWLVDKLGPRALITVGVIMWAIGFAMLSQIDSIGGFYVAVILLAIGTSLCGFFPVTVTIIQWFSKNRGRALAISSMGMGLGGMCIPLIGWSMDTFGWRHTAMASSAIAVLIGVPLATVFRRRPEDYGQTIDGLPPQPKLNENDASEGVNGQAEFTTREALRTSAFWLIGLGHGSALLVVTAINVHGITHMKQGLGYSLSEASLVITLMTFFQLGGNSLGVWIGDRFDKRRITAFCMLMHGVGLLFLTYSTNIAMLVVFAMLHGAAWGLRGPAMQAMRADYFGRNAIGMIMGLSALITVVGQIIGPMLAGAFADYTGNYVTGFTILAVMGAAGAGFFLAIKTPEQVARAKMAKSYPPV